MKLRLRIITLKSIFSIFFILLFVSPAFSESKLSLCDGVWTTKTCEKPEKSFVGRVRPDNTPVSEIEEIISDKNKTEDGVKDEPSAEIKTEDNPKKSEALKNPKQITSIIHRLTMRSIALKDKYQKDYDISSARQFCEDPKTSLDECRKSVDLEIDKIRDYEIKLEGIALEERQLEEAAKASEEPKVQNNITVNQITNTIVKVREKNAPVPLPLPNLPSNGHQQ